MHISLLLNASSGCNFLLFLKTCSLLSLTIPATAAPRKTEVQILAGCDCTIYLSQAACLLMKQNCATSISSWEEIFIHGHESLGTSLNWNSKPQAGLIAISHCFIMNCGTSNPSYHFSSYNVSCIMSVYNERKLIRGSLTRHRKIVCATKRLASRCVRLCQKLTSQQKHWTLGSLNKF